MSHREPSRRRTRRTRMSWEDCPIAAEAEHMDTLLRAQGYERSKLIRVFLRADGLVTCRYVWRHRDAGAALALTVTTLSMEGPRA